MRKASILLAAAAWALAGPLQAAPPPVHLLERVRAVGGHPIREVEEGVVFRRVGGCGVALPPAAPAGALAASLGSDLRLDVEIRSCPAGAPPPAGECRLQVGEGAPASVPVAGRKVTVPVALPAETGARRWSLRCVFSGGVEQRLDGDLYVTLAKPAFPVREPWEDWYRLATTWGEGLEAGDPPEAALERVLHGLHDHGQRFWRYGYCTREDASCVFGHTSIHIRSRELFGIGKLRTCRWFLLAEGNPRCNFTDCFGFSALFTYISGTLGVGVRAVSPIQGSEGEGFSTRGWLKALDPAAGNLDCGYRGLGCAFLFAEHSLVRKDGALYDATFGQTYRDVGGLIAQDIVDKQEGVVFLESSRACPLSLPPYGAFSLFREVPRGAEACPRSFNRPAYFLLDSGESLQPGDVELESVEGDARPELVRVRLVVEVAIAGSYQVFGSLAGGPDGELVVVTRPRHQTQTLYSSHWFSGLPGTYEVTLTFSGQDLVDSGVPPPYWIDATIVSGEGIADNLHRQLPRLSFEGLGEQPVDLEGAAGTEVRRPGGPGAVLRVSVPVDVRTAGTYAVAAYLSSGGRTVAESGSFLKLSPEQGALTLEFPGDEIARQGLDGTYALDVEIHALDAESRAPLQVVEVFTQEIGPFRASDFRRP